MPYEPKTVSDVARLTVYEDLCAVLRPEGYDLELSAISIRIYKENSIVAILWLYPNDITLSFRVSGKHIPLAFNFADPKFFDKVKDAVVSCLRKA